MKYKSVPIKAAKDIAKAYDKNQVIIATWDDVHKIMHVATYGKSVKECAQAAIGGNFVKAALGWPPKECEAVPARLKAKIIKEYLQEQKAIDDDWSRNYDGWN